MGGGISLKSVKRVAKNENNDQKSWFKIYGPNVLIDLCEWKWKFEICIGTFTHNQDYPGLEIEQPKYSTVSQQVCIVQFRKTSAAAKLDIQAAHKHSQPVYFFVLSQKSSKII